MALCRTEIRADEQRKATEWVHKMAANLEKDIPGISKEVLERQLKSALPGARQCGRCGVGPVMHQGCDDLAAHHGQMVGTTRIDNCCKSCGWFEDRIDFWPPWDGKLRSSPHLARAEPSPSVAAPPPTADDPTAGSTPAPPSDVYIANRCRGLGFAHLMCMPHRQEPTDRYNWDLVPESEIELGHTVQCQPCGSVFVIARDQAVTANDASVAAAPSQQPRADSQLSDPCALQPQLSQLPMDKLLPLLRSLQLTRDELRALSGHASLMSSSAFFVRLNMSTVAEARYVGVQVAAVHGEEVRVRGIEAAAKEQGSLRVQRTKLQYVSNRSFEESEIIDMARRLVMGSFEAVSKVTVHKSLQAKQSTL